MERGLKLLFSVRSDFAHQGILGNEWRLVLLPCGEMGRYCWHLPGDGEACYAAYREQGGFPQRRNTQPEMSVVLRLRN